MVKARGLRATVDNDGWPDLYVSVLGGPTTSSATRARRSARRPMFADVTEQAGVARADGQLHRPGSSTTTTTAGWTSSSPATSATLPNIVREYLGQKDQAEGERPRLYRNNGDGTFTDVSREVGLDQLLLTMGANFGDLDNDGWLDFYLGTGDAAARPRSCRTGCSATTSGKRFQDVTTSGGFGHLQKGHGGRVRRHRQQRQPGHRSR